MEEKRKYVVYSEVNYETVERVVVITKAQANAIRWFMENYDIDGCVEPIENYEGEEI